MLYRAGAVYGNSISCSRLKPTYTGSTWAEDTATQGCDRSAVQRPEWRGGASRPAPQPFWRESVKSREREGSALAFREASFLVALFLQSAAAVLVRQLRGPHLSTWPWCSRRSSMALTAATSASSLPQSSTGRLEVSRVLARS